MTKSTMPFSLTFKVDKLRIQLACKREELGLEAVRAVGDTIRELMQQQAFINVIFASTPSWNEILAALIQE